MGNASGSPGKSDPGARGPIDGRSRAARARARDARAEILSAALRVFALRGYREATMDAIAAEAGYSKGALYWHFGGKQELLLTLLEERIDQPMRERFAVLASASPEQDMAGGEAPGVGGGRGGGGGAHLIQAAGRRA